jgi:hypothetical protein
MLLSSLLVACHSDEHTSTSSDSGSLASNAYTGKTDSAELKPSNIKGFSKSPFASRDFSLAAVNLISTNPDGNGNRHLKTALKFSIGEANRQNRSTNETQACSNGGKVLSSGNMDTATKLGLIKSTFTNCLIDGVVLDGNIETEVSAYDTAANEPTSLKITFKQLKLLDSNKVLTTVVGTVEAEQNLATKKTTLLFNTYISDTNVEVLTDMQITTRVNTNDYTVSSTFKGNVCVGIEGCINMTTDTPFIVDYNGGLKAGKLLFTGANNSTANLTVIKYNSTKYSIN